jgi:hypothetical protein
MDPCSYWAPMPLKSSECSTTDADNERVVYINYRPPEYDMTVCPCRFPCTPEFDRIQYCGINLTREDEDETISKMLKPKMKAVQIPQYKAMQLCRGMKDFLEKSDPIRINSIPIRIRPLSKTIEKIKDCVTWKYTPCIGETNYELDEPITNSSEITTNTKSSERQDETNDDGTIIFFSF